MPSIIAWGSAGYRSVEDYVTLTIGSQRGDELDSLLVPILHPAEQFHRVAFDVRYIDQPVMGIAEQHQIRNGGFQFF